MVHRISDPEKGNWVHIELGDDDREETKTERKHEGERVRLWLEYERRYRAHQRTYERNTKRQVRLPILPPQIHPLPHPAPIAQQPSAPHAQRLAQTQALTRSTRALPVPYVLPPCTKSRTPPHEHPARASVVREGRSRRLNSSSSSHSRSPRILNLLYRLLPFSTAFSFAFQFSSAFTFTSSLIRLSASLHPAAVTVIEGEERSGYRFSSNAPTFAPIAPPTPAFAGESSTDKEHSARAGLTSDVYSHDPVLGVEPGVAVMIAHEHRRERRRGECDLGLEGGGRDWHHDGGCPFGVVFTVVEGGGGGGVVVAEMLSELVLGADVSGGSSPGKRSMVIIVGGNTIHASLLSSLSGATRMKRNWDDEENEHVKMRVCGQPRPALNASTSPAPPAGLRRGDAIAMAADIIGAKSWRPKAPTLLDIPDKHIPAALHSLLPILVLERISREGPGFETFRFAEIAAVHVDSLFKEVAQDGQRHFDASSQTRRARLGCLSWSMMERASQLLWLYSNGNVSLSPEYGTYGVSAHSLIVRRGECGGDAEGERSQSRDKCDPHTNEVVEFGK
ncbi:hypothetical protein DFP72DRAFT_1045037 [Ephemerocybe angulata]|uniref:Uncharacterized protein n=1 Tax=Ephemerocybe angulata TaxID=980116 RepID=A0A8H6M553_9AGAR|nr:hypothetical protein DFP72DRAFT_1045037 [Tulosesus angulatus]